MPRSDAKAKNSTRGSERLAQALPDCFTPDRRVLAGGITELASETRDLLHRRLFAASLILAFGFGVFLVRDLCFARVSQNLVYLHCGLFALLVLNVLVLSGRWQPSMRQLRILELVTFATVAAFFVAGQSMGLQARLDQDRLTAADLRVLFKTSIIGTLFLIFTYGIFIPNTWKRAASVIVPLALLPLVAPFFLSMTSATFRTLSQEARTPDKLAENALFLTLGAVTAIFGTHTINTFRTEAFQAKRLNQYRLSARLGAGGMGEVYLAEHELLKRPCAIKLIRPGLTQKPRVLARFELEVRATAQLSHWNTVEVYDYGRAGDGTFYYVMEYLPGLSLQQLVDRHGPLPAARVIYLLKPACDALREAHQAGLIHRDLKPPNVFAAYRGARFDVAKLLDFGLVKPTKNEDPLVLTREGMVTGSPLYMAPEQVTRTHPPDARTDIYAMGAIAYFLLAGRPPFVGSSAMAAMVAHARDPVVPPSKHRADVPSDLEAVVLRCLEKDPRDRYQDCDSLARALAACADAEGWSPEQAEAWWRREEPQVLADAAEPASSVKLARLDLTDPDVTVTLDACEIEEAADSAEGGSGSLSGTIAEDSPVRDRQR